MYQYFHQMDEPKRFTACVDVPDKETLLLFTSLYFPKDLRITYGLVNVIGNDRYCKATGRNYCNNRMSSHKFTLTSVDYIEDQMYLNLYNPKISITIRLFPRGKKSHLINVELNEEL